MYLVKNHDIELLLDPDTNTPYEAESYTISSRRRVTWDYKSQSWRDRHNREYTPVRMGKIIGFNMKNTLSKTDKEILSTSPEGKAYVEYNEKIGGDPIGLLVPTGYPSVISEYLEQGGTIEEIYRDCIERGISWEELLSCYVEKDPNSCDEWYVEVLWDP